MKRNQRNNSEQESQVIRLWTHKEATQALPYLRSVQSSIREHWLDLNQAQGQLMRLERKPGRPDRDTLLKIEDTRKEVDQALEKVNEDLQELAARDVYCLDPACGLALIPFRKGDDLAWYVLDLFDPEGVQSWRLHSDPLETRRPMAEAESVPAVTNN
jgi:hypothetical protein